METTPANPPTPKPSSTVMVLRPISEQSSGYEVFMVRRHSKSRFMPDRYVFPGGRLEESDASPATLARLANFSLEGSEPVFRDLPGQGAHDAEVKLSRAQQAGMYIAAFRELFEEAGVLLAINEASGQPLEVQEDDELAERFAVYRKEMQADRLDFVSMLEQEKLLLDFNKIIYFSHWITPLVEPYRFDARFFLTTAPHNQVAESDYFETTHGLWITPWEILERYAADDFNIAFPTLLHIQWLSNYNTLETACEAARRKTIVAAMPNHYMGEDGMVFQLPEDVVDRW
ncbi:MAG TPA: hypothetical protein VH186_18875 [Chloroflexia bacterium]|nr:hypothetical protein [Chloroflexia bacterium]